MSINAFEQGKLAYRNNHPMSSCEFPTGSSLRTDWMAGWTEARISDERKAHGEPQSPLMKDASLASRIGRSEAHES